jgi:hypothetical protein
MDGIHKVPLPLAAIALARRGPAQQGVSDGHYVDDDTKTPDITPNIIALLLQDFWRDIFWCACRDVSG